MKIFYTNKQAVDQGQQGFSIILKSPSAKKPAQIAEALKNVSNVTVFEPSPLTRDDLKLCHDPDYVDRIMDLQEDNGFGNRSKEVAESLLYTTGAMYDAAKIATARSPACALVAGFHHAGYKQWKDFGYFCTFNGLMVTAVKLLTAEHGMSRIAIIDADMHWGNGTDDILNKNPHLKDFIYHYSFGKYYHNPRDATRYLKDLEMSGPIFKEFKNNKPDIVIYQAGADVHVDDPYGGILTTEQMYERDKLMFSITKELKIPIVWNLAGGYQIDQDGSYEKVIKLHLNTFKACQEVYGDLWV